MGGKVVNSMLMTDCITAVMDMGDDKHAPRDPSQKISGAESELVVRVYMCCMVV